MVTLEASLRPKTHVKSNLAAQEAVGLQQKAGHTTASFYLVCTQHGLRGSLDQVNRLYQYTGPPELKMNNPYDLCK